MLNLLPLAATSTVVSASSTATAGSSALSMLVTLSPILLIVLVFYFLMIRPQRKREKKTTEMRNSLQVGDEITTVGGVIGRVVMIKEDSLVIETGADRSKLRIKKWAVQGSSTIHDESK
ncbi:MAG: preprotein translocase subunit YajC [Clostridia bacterium]|nr:preprotein translocase subunit YajC [Clostridia bacterium]